MQLLIATTNPGKLREYRGQFSDYELFSLADFPKIVAPEETGATFTENALIKARSAYQATGIASLGDDGGFEIDALGGEPGVKSRRWIDGVTEASDEDLIAYTLKRLEGIPKEKRTARLRLVLAFVYGDIEHLVETSIEGLVLEHAPLVCEEGYPYRSLFYIPQYGKLYGELTTEEHNASNHRIRASKEMRGFLDEAVIGKLDY